MAATGFSISTYGTAVGSKFTQMKALDETSQDNVTGGAPTVNSIDIDSTLNTGEDNFLKGVDAATAAPGTDQAFIQIKGRKGIVQSVVFGDGHVFATGLSAWCVQSAALASVTGPTGTVNVDVNS